MTVILANQLYWEQADHVRIVKKQYELSFVNKGKKILHLEDVLMEINTTVAGKSRVLEEHYVELYDEHTITWSKYDVVVGVDIFSAV